MTMTHHKICLEMRHNHTH